MLGQACASQQPAHQSHLSARVTKSHPAPGKDSFSFSANMESCFLAKDAKALPLSPRSAHSMPNRAQHLSFPIHLLTATWTACKPRDCHPASPPLGASPRGAVGTGIPGTRTEAAPLPAARGPAALCDALTVAGKSQGLTATSRGTGLSRGGTLPGRRGGGGEQARRAALTSGTWSIAPPAVS